MMKNLRSLEAKLIHICELRPKVSPTIGIYETEEGYRVSSGMFSATNQSIETAVDDLLALILKMYSKR